MEVLIAAAIGVVISGVLIMLFFNIIRSSTMTTSHAEARDIARDGIARLSREIRDVEAVAGAEAVPEAKPTSIAFTTTFNRVGAEVDTTKPRLVRYWYVPAIGSGDSLLYRDLYAEGTVLPNPLPSNFNWNSLGTPQRRTLITHVLNDADHPIFSYTYMSGSPTPIRLAGTVADATDRSHIVLVHLYVSVDLDTGRSPTPMQITTQAQLRNQRIIE